MKFGKIHFIDTDIKDEENENVKYIQIKNTNKIKYNLQIL